MERKSSVKVKMYKVKFREISQISGPKCEQRKVNACSNGYFAYDVQYKISGRIIQATICLL